MVKLRSWEGMARGIRPRWRLESQGIKERPKIAHAKRTNKGMSVFIGYFYKLVAQDVGNVVLQLSATHEHLQIRDGLGDILKIACMKEKALPLLYVRLVRDSLGVHA